MSWDEVRCRCECVPDACEPVINANGQSVKRFWDDLKCECECLSSSDQPPNSHWDSHLCEWVICKPKSCDHAQYLDFKDCECKCNIQICAAEFIFNTETCQCECIQTVSCNTNEYWNNKNCKCQCIPMQCSPSYFWDAGSC
jgi:hypothetical protein